LDKSYENSDLKDLLSAPVDALTGVSTGDAQALQSAFGVETVGDLGKNKFARAAVALVDLGNTAG
jgi:hypothetical protein